MKKILYSIVFVFCFAFLANAFAVTVTMSHYPSSAQAKKFLENNIEEIRIKSTWNGNKLESKVGYPSSSHVKALNLMDTIWVYVETLSSAYPSKAAASRMSKLGQSHIDLKLVIENCLSTNNEAEKLMNIERPAKVNIECHTKRAVEKAELLAAKVETHSQLDIDILLVK